MKIGIPKETFKNETRVSLIPSSIPQFLKKGHEVFVESGAGAGAEFDDSLYEKAGAKILRSAKELYEASEIIFKVQPPTSDEAKMIREGTAYIGYIAPFTNTDLIKTFASRKITGFSMEFIPRITRAQSMDSLSSMSMVSGYKAVLIAAAALPRMFPLIMTAAGTISPATVIVLGAGVAGLQAIASARRLGAKVEAFDPRAAVKEQIESLGATFIAMENVEDVSTAGGYAKEASDAFLKKEQEAISARLPKADVVITTAQIFGKKAPVLITEEMIKLMPAGAVIVDLAAEQGGNCELTKAGDTVRKYGVTIIGAVNLPATVPSSSSQLYSKNLMNLFFSVYADPGKGLDFEDDVVKSACLTHAGEIKNDTIKTIVSK